MFMVKNMVQSPKTINTKDPIPISKSIALNNQRALQSYNRYNFEMMSQDHFDEPI
jgi:hypothetical protein